jgi:hypothetical protein
MEEDSEDMEADMILCDEEEKLSTRVGLMSEREPFDVAIVL